MEPKQYYGILFIPKSLNEYMRSIYIAREQENQSENVTVS